MKFTQHYSSSGGNLYTLECDGSRLLIECGVPWTKVLKALNHDLEGIEGCLLTHEHKDHSRAAQDVAEYGIDLYASSGTFAKISEYTHIPKRRKKVMAHGSCWDFGKFKVTAYNANHDAKEPFIYTIKCADGESLLFATDTSHIMQRFDMAFTEIALECSYDIDILRERVDSCTIHESLAKRLLTSHQERSAAMAYLATYCDLSRCRRIHLLHMSADNIDKEATRKHFERIFVIETVTV